jgi:nicotinate-nucleotide adenylyltransferase
MRKIAVYGGSFDPVTLGHTRVAEIVLNTCDVDQVWFMPCYKSLYEKKLGSSYDRINLLCCA